MLTFGGGWGEGHTGSLNFSVGQIFQNKKINKSNFLGMQAGAATLENSVEVPQKIKNRTTLRPSNGTTKIGRAVV